VKGETFGRAFWHIFGILGLPKAIGLQQLLKIKRKFVIQTLFANCNIKGTARIDFNFKPNLPAMQFYNGFYYGYHDFTFRLKNAFAFLPANALKTLFLNKFEVPELKTFRKRAE